MTNKKISVIIPVYNREKYIDACINSVLDQENVNIEIILVDDGSTDSSPAICDRYCSEHANITTIHTENHGVCHARNTGLDSSTGDYIYFLDSDDLLPEGALEALQCAIEKYDADYSIGELSYQTEDGEIITRFSVPSEYSNRQLTRNDVLNLMVDTDSRLVIVACNKLFKKEIWSSLRFNEKYRICEDDKILVPILRNANTIVAIDKVTYHYIASPNSLIRNKTTMEHLADTNIDIINYSLSLGNYRAAMFRFGQGTRNIHDYKRDLKSKEAKIKIKELYKEYCLISKKLAPHVNLKEKIRFALFRFNFDLYDFVRIHL